MHVSEDGRAYDDYYVVVKEHNHWSPTSVTKDVVKAFMDLERIQDQEYLYNAGNGVEAMVITQTNFCRGEMLPVRRTPEIVAAIKMRKEGIEASKAVVLDLEAIEREKPRWAEYNARTNKTVKADKPKTEDKAVAVIDPKEPDKAPEPSKAFLAWLKK